MKNSFCSLLLSIISEIYKLYTCRCCAKITLFVLVYSHIPPPFSLSTYLLPLSFPLPLSLPPPVTHNPAGTPYEGGVFRMKLVLSRDFPASPPQGFFLTKIFHPNVAKNGAICVNTLKKDWKPDHGIKHILLVGVTV